jgi:RNA-binding protein
MELTSKQKSALKSIAQTIKPAFQLGKGGLTDVFMQNIIDYLSKNEIGKITLLQTTPTEMEEITALLTEQKIHIVQEIGNQIIVYKRNPKLKDTIRLPR